MTYGKEGLSDEKKKILIKDDSVKVKRFITQDVLEDFLFLWLFITKEDSAIHVHFSILIACYVFKNLVQKSSCSIGGFQKCKTGQKSLYRSIREHAKNDDKHSINLSSKRPTKNIGVRSEFTKRDQEKYFVERKSTHPSLSQTGRRGTRTHKHARGHIPKDFTKIKNKKKKNMR